MILDDEYFQDSVVNFDYKPTALDHERVDDLLTRVNALLDEFGEPLELRSGHRTRAKSLALIAAGYRAAVGGNHEKSLAIDIADPHDHLDAWLNDQRLESYGLWREHPADTISWVHVQTVPPKSGARTFKP